VYRLAYHVDQHCTGHLGGKDGMPEVPKFNDVGTLLRFFPHFLRVEMYEMRRNHGSHNFQKSAQELHKFHFGGSLTQWPFNRF
jgi:hypothetical protein